MSADGLSLAAEESRPGMDWSERRQGHTERRSKRRIKWRGDTRMDGSLRERWLACVEDFPAWRFFSRVWSGDGAHLT